MRGGGIWRGLFPLVVGLIAVALSAGAGASPIALLVALVLYMGAFLFSARKTAAGLAFMAAGALALGTPLDGIYSPRAVWVLAALILALAPVFLHLGGALPYRRLPWFLGVSLVVPLLLLLHPASATILLSDIALRLQVALIAVGTLLAVLFVGLPAPPKEGPVKDHERPPEDADVFTDNDAWGPSR